MIAKYNTLAQKTGAKIVSFCGHDSVPWDLSTLLLANKLKEEGDKLAFVEFCNDSKGEASGGTLATARLALGRINDMPRYDFDPFMMNKEGVKSSSKTIVKNPILPSKFTKTGNSHYAGDWTAPFVMAEVNAAVVKRSIALSEKDNIFSKNGVEYKESMKTSSLPSAALTTVGLGILTVSLLNPITSAIMKRILPKQGEGPSSKTMSNGFLIVSGVGTGEKGAVAESAIRVPKVRDEY